METDGIRAFCMSIVGENDHGRDIYVRIRTWNARSKAQTVASQIPATDVNHLTLALDLERRYHQLQSESPVWLEAVLEGTSKVVDTLKLPACSGDLLDTNLAQQMPSDLGMSQMGVRLGEAVVAMSRDANERATLSNHMWLESQGNMMNIFKALAKSQAEVMIHETLDSQDNVSEALGILSPLIPALASKLGHKGGTAPPLHEDAAEDIGGLTDQMIDVLCAVAADHPDVITSDRVARLVGIVN